MKRGAETPEQVGSGSTQPRLADSPYLPTASLPLLKIYRIRAQGELAFRVSYREMACPSKGANKPWDKLVESSHSSSSDKFSRKSQAGKKVSAKRRAKTKSPPVINRWRAQADQNRLSATLPARERVLETEKERLKVKIGDLVMQNDFLKKFKTSYNGEGWALTVMDYWIFSSQVFGRIKGDTIQC